MVSPSVPLKDLLLYLTLLLRKKTERLLSFRKVHLPFVGTVSGLYLFSFLTSPYVVYKVKLVSYPTYLPLQFFTNRPRSDLRLGFAGTTMTHYPSVTPEGPTLPVQVPIQKGPSIQDSHNLLHSVPVPSVAPPMTLGRPFPFK